jgi:hypothetical protein
MRSLIKQSIKIRTNKQLNIQVLSKLVFKINKKSLFKKIIKYKTQIKTARRV